MHEQYMRMALAQAREAATEGEVPVGAVLVAGGRVLVRTHNLVERLGDVTAHAEMQAIGAAAGALGGKYLDRCTLYVTVEPCPMCAAALRWAQLGALVYGADDPKRGYSTISGELLHPKTEVLKGVLANECAEVMTTFFEQMRKKRL